MPSSLNIAQKIALFEILEIPYYSGFFTTDGMAALAKQTSLSGTATSAYTQLNTFLDSLTSLNGETELIAYITRWIAIGTKTSKMDAGNVGNLTGLTFDYDHERKLIRDRVKYIVPFYPWAEVLARQTTGGSGGDSISIGVMR